MKKLSFYNQIPFSSNSDKLANQTIRNNPLNQQIKPSKWALFVQEIKNNPELQLGDYAEQFKKDMQEFREGFIFFNDCE